MPKRRPNPWSYEGVRYHQRGRHRRKVLDPLLLLVGLAGGGFAVGAASIFGPTLIAPSAPEETLIGCRATDGDTLRCGSERIRLIGIDAPELPGHCRRGRNCAPGDPYASTRSLAHQAEGTLRIDRAGIDHYGRTLAMVAGPAGDMSCQQLARNQAIYRMDWDDGLRVARTCPGSLIW